MIKIGAINYTMGLDAMCFPTIATCKCLGYSGGFYLIETDGIKMSIDAKYGDHYSTNKDEILQKCVAQIKEWEKDIDGHANCEMRRKYPQLFK